MEMAFAEYWKYKISLKRRPRKNSEITIHVDIKKAYSKLVNRLNEDDIEFQEDDFVFISQKGSVYHLLNVSELNVSAMFLLKSALLSSFNSILHRYW